MRAGRRLRARRLQVRRWVGKRGLRGRLGRRKARPQRKHVGVLILDDSAHLDTHSVGSQPVEPRPLLVREFVGGALDLD